MQHIVVVCLQNQWQLPGEFGCARFQKAERRRIGIASGLQSEIEMVARIVGRRIGFKAASRTMFESLVDRKDDELAGAGECAVIQQPGEVR